MISLEQSIQRNIPINIEEEEEEEEEGMCEAGEGYDAEI